MEPSFGFRVFKNTSYSIAKKAYAQSATSTQTDELKQKIESQEVKIAALEKRITAEEMSTIINSVSIVINGLAFITLSLKRRL